MRATGLLPDRYAGGTTVATVSFFVEVVSTFTNELSIARESATKMLSELE